MPGVLDPGREGRVLAGGEALEVGHRSDEGVWEPGALQRHLRPVATAADQPQFVGLAGRIVEQQAELDAIAERTERELARLRSLPESAITAMADSLLELALSPGREDAA